MRVYERLEKIVARFMQGDQNYSLSRCSTYLEGGVLYSYGPHFVLAKRLDRSMNLYVVSAESYSMSTSRHAADVVQILRANGAKVIRAINLDESCADILIDNGRRARDRIFRSRKASTVELPKRSMIKYSDIWYEYVKHAKVDKKTKATGNKLFNLKDDTELVIKLAELEMGPSSYQGR